MTTKKQDQGTVVVVIVTLWLMVMGVVTCFFAWPIGALMLIVSALLAYAVYMLTSR